MNPPRSAGGSGTVLHQSRAGTRGTGRPRQSVSARCESGHSHGSKMRGTTHVSGRRGNDPREPYSHCSVRQSIVRYLRIRFTKAAMAWPRSMRRRSSVARTQHHLNVVAATASNIPNPQNKQPPGGQSGGWIPLPGMHLRGDNLKHSRSVQWPANNS